MNKKNYRPEIQKATAPQTWIKNGRNIFNKNTPAYLPEWTNNHQEFMNELYQLELQK